MDVWHGICVAGAAFAAGAVNSVAGGGTLLTFPALVWVGLSPVTANATSTVAIWPGTLGSLWGYRQELSQAERPLLALLAPSLVGGILGAWLLRFTPPAVFAALVPYLILFATLLFMLQQPVQRWMGHHESAPARRSGRWLAAAGGFQLLVALYGGYFGAGIGILMLAALSILGLRDMHEMNGLKVLFGLSINGVAAIYFVWARMVYWPDVLLMVAASIAGGYGGVGLARRIGQEAVRRVVIVIGFSMAVSLFLKR